MKKRLLIMLLTLMILAAIHTGCADRSASDMESQVATRGNEIPPPPPGQGSGQDAGSAYFENVDKDILPSLAIYKMDTVYHPSISHITALASCIMYYLPDLTYPQVLMYARPTRFCFDEGGREFNMGPAPLVSSMLDMIKNLNFHPTIGYMGMPTEGTRLFQNDMGDNGSVLDGYRDARQLFRVIKMKVSESIPVIVQVDLKELGFTDESYNDSIIITGYDEDHVYAYFTWKMGTEPNKIVLGDFMDAWSSVGDMVALGPNFLLSLGFYQYPPDIGSMEDTFREDAMQASGNIDKFIDYIDATRHIPPMIGETGQQMTHAASIYYEKSGQNSISGLYSSAMETYSKMDDNLEIEQYLELCRQLKEEYSQAVLLIEGEQ